jgi:hypothetical protein
LGPPGTPGSEGQPGDNGQPGVPGQPSLSVGDFPGDSNVSKTFKPSSILFIWSGDKLLSFDASQHVPG